MDYCQVFETAIEKVPVPTYTAEEHGTWQLLMEAQEKLVPQNACREFIEGVRKVNFPRDHIPAVKDISQRIESFTGWKLIRVDGLVHPRDFFSLLSRKIFPTTDFIRKREDLKYTPAPDMFHDLFGHTPLLTNPDFTEFFEFFGRVGVKAYKKFAETDEIHERLTRIYWFTVEFGLIQNQDGVKAYGSGNTSSPEEIEFCLSDRCRKHPFDIETVTHKSYDIWKLQEEVFVITSFQELGRAFRGWAKVQGLDT